MFPELVMFDQPVGWQKVLSHQSVDYKFSRSSFCGDLLKYNSSKIVYRTGHKMDSNKHHLDNASVIETSGSQNPILDIVVAIEQGKCPQQVAAQVPGKGWQRSGAHLTSPAILAVGHSAKNQSRSIQQIIRNRTPIRWGSKNQSITVCMQNIKSWIHI